MKDGFYGYIINAKSPGEGMAQLLEKKHRDKQGKYLIEGIHLVQEALRSGADLECVALTRSGDSL